eukprot:TRINITY_DN1084_c0_g1_i1.p2 TRINITY_DN1084_c0_g1~~TRINITY_DN1084_c0_g1_i1.p2  ORF type:complete len:124 (+),score=14.45 TRINITY_DN1084_c0_g1_i1:27-374(+)
MENISIQNCVKDGFYFSKCYKIFAKNIDILGCQESGGSFFEIKNFSIENFTSKNCSYGFFFSGSNGKFINGEILFKIYGLRLICSNVAYDQIQFVNSDDKNVYKDNSSFFNQIIF